MIRITKDKYNKPPITYTESLSRENIKDLLQNYDQVDDIKSIKIGTHLRYFSKNKEGKYNFRLGGELKNNDGLPNYIVLSNKFKSWCVQIQETIFYSKKNN